MTAVYMSLAFILNKGATISIGNSILNVQAFSDYVSLLAFNSPVTTQINLNYTGYFG